jgi:hypothetical protein
MKQKGDILKKIPKIKHELFMIMSIPEIGLAVEQRDFGVMKKHLLQAVNKFSSRPVETVYIENYFFN